MSWFKRGGERKSQESIDQSQTDTDPNTCLEVFQNHWKQAWAVISGQDKKTTAFNGQSTADGVEVVLRNLEQMVTLLVSEDDDGGLPGPILNYVMESEVLEQFCAWCTINVSAHDKLRMQQLRLFELIISQSRQLLLIHRPVIKPLLRLLIDVAESHEISNGELEFKLVLVLHQICICISQQNLILESFFSSDTDHGPARFLIFSLLIPYIHREGPVGQKARDALLLIMTLSARHPHIGQYIANNSDFCPVLATGLSGLYSSLPRKITPPTDDWHAITWEDCIRIPDLQMFLNSLQFSNAVVQVAHPLVRQQLIEFIYSGFLVPVLAPALNQISREEAMTATAYLDLFIRHVTEPHLLKAVLKFVLVEKYDDVPVLESLLSRINSNSHLSMVTLSLFHTLIDLNCEDVMFQLVFRYLVPCTHVMVSQRRSVRDLDLYSKSAEKFLSLRPKCCSWADATNPPANALPAPPPHIVGMSAQAQRSSINNVGTITGPSLSVTSSSEDRVEQLQWETNYFEYLHDARNKLEQTMRACRHWSFPYDGESPPPDSIAKAEKAAAERSETAEQQKLVQRDAPPATGYIELGSILKISHGEEGSGNRNNAHVMTFNPKDAADRKDIPPVVAKEKCNSEHKNDKYAVDLNLYSSLENVDTFIGYLNEVNEASDVSALGNSQSIDQCIADLSDLLTALPARLHVAGGSSENSQNKSSNSANVPLTSPVVSDPTIVTVKQSEVPKNEVGVMNSPGDSHAAGEEICTSVVPGRSGPVVQREQNVVDDASLVAETSKYNQQDASGDSSLMAKTPKGNQRASTPLTGSRPDQRTATTSQTVFSSSPPVSSRAVNKERNIPQDLPTPLRSGQNQSYSSMFSPMHTAGDMLSPFKSVLSPGDEFHVTMTSPVLKKLTYLNDPPNIGPFLSALFTRLEGMVGNSLYFNLLLTGTLSRLAAYPQPLLRSFLLNHNLVFQPSVKSLIQVLSSVRQKVDSFSLAVKHFDSLVASARQNLVQREEQMLYNMDLAYTPALPSVPLKPRADTISGSSTQILKEKKKVTLSDLIFRRSPGKDKIQQGKLNKKHVDLDQLQVGASKNHHINNHSGSESISSIADYGSSPQTLSTWNAVYCALILDEFLKDLAAISQEHSVLHSDEGYLSS